MIKEIVDNGDGINVTGSRTIFLENGNKMHATMGAYGFWSVHYDKGELPDELKNKKWTSFDKLHQAVDLYFRHRQDTAPKPRVEKVKLTPRV